MGSYPFALIIIFLQTVEGICPNSSFVEEPTKQKCYLLSSQKARWYDAKIQCEAAGSMLAKLEDDIDHQFVVQYMVENEFYWIGMNDIDSELMYVWTDNTPIMWTNWRFDEPTNSDTQDCVMITRDRKWADNSCHTSRYFTCQSVVGESQENHRLFQRISSIADVVVLARLQVRSKIACISECLQTLDCKYVAVDMSATSDNCQLLKTETGGELTFSPSSKLYLPVQE